MSSNRWLKKPENTSQSDLRRIAEEKAARNSSPVDTTSHPEPTSLPVSESHADKPSLVNPPPLALPAESHAVSTSLPDTEELTENLAALAYQLEYRAGNLRINFDYFDKIVGKLSRNARLLYIYLLRYREGSTNYTVRLNWPTLEKKTDISKSVLYRSARELEAAGLAFSEGLQLGKGKDQGFRFRLSHTASHTVSGSLSDTTSLPVSADNNRKALTVKSNRDISRCLDCEGRGYFYPQGFDKGVVLCRHERLS